MAFSFTTFIVTICIEMGVGIFSLWTEVEQYFEITDKALREKHVKSTMAAVCLYTAGTLLIATGIAVLFGSI